MALGDPSSLVTSDSSERTDDFQRGLVMTRLEYEWLSINAGLHILSFYD